jgi:hypothetical protein
MEPSLGSAFDEPIARALARNPSLRPTATELGSMLATALERWRAEPASMGLHDQTTLTRVPLPANGVPATGEAPTPPRSGRTLGVAGALLAALLLGLAAFLLFGSNDPGPTASPSATASVGGSPSASASARPSATATADQFADARAASDEMRAAIADAGGDDGLKGRDARDLEKILDRFDRALDTGDTQAARDEADQLAAQVAELIEEDDVDDEVAERLRTAADGLVDAANGLPD